MAMISKIESGVSEFSSTRGATQTNTFGAFLRSMGNTWGVKLELNHHGVCNFQYSGLKFEIETPPHSKKFHLSSCLIKCNPSSHKVLQKALRLNYFNKKTNGYVLSLKPPKPLKDEALLEIVLCHTESISGKRHSTLTRLVRNFIEISIRLREELEKVHLREIDYRASLVPKHTHSIVRRKSIHPSRLIPPLPPQELDFDATPIISNKKLDRKVASTDHAERQATLPTRKIVKVRSTIVQASQRKSFGVKDEKVSASTSATDEGKESCRPPKPRDKRRSKIIHRISRMASKKFYGASFRRYSSNRLHRTSEASEN